MSTPNGHRLTEAERHDLATCWNDADGNHKAARWDEVLWRVERILAARAQAHPAPEGGLREAVARAAKFPHTVACPSGSINVCECSALERVDAILAALAAHPAPEGGLREAIKALAARHYDEGTGEWSGRPHVCGGCGRDWPCEDRRAIDDALAAHPAPVVQHLKERGRAYPPDPAPLPDPGPGRRWAVIEGVPILTADPAPEGGLREVMCAGGCGTAIRVVTMPDGSKGALMTCDGPECPGNIQRHYPIAHPAPIEPPATL